MWAQKLMAAFFFPFNEVFGNLFQNEQTLLMQVNARLS